MSEWPSYFQGDAEAVVSEILTYKTPELEPYGVTISTNLVGYTRLARWIEVTESGGLAKWPVIYRPRIDLHVYAERRSVALDITQICVGSVQRVAGNYHNYGFWLGSVDVESGPIRIPDPLQEVTRYVTSLRLTGRGSTSPEPLPPLS